MPRNPSGIYSLPSGNPVVSGTLIEASWANNTLSDLASSMTDSLSRSGEGGMTAPLRLADGSLSTPGMAFSSETSTGFYRAGSGDVRLAITGSQLVQFLGSGVAITGTLSASGNLAVNTDKFTVAASSGNTAVAGTLAVTGTSTFTGAITATGGVTGAVTGNASTATALQNSRTIWGQSFDGTANVSGALTGVSDITASGNVTLSGGTANGVPYLNASKVLTSGSSFTYDGSATWNMASSNPLLKLTGDAGSYYTTIQGFAGGYGASKGFHIDTYNGLRLMASGDITFYPNGTTLNNGSEIARFTSAGLGIGTSSPAQALHVVSTGNVIKFPLRLQNDGTSGSTLGAGQEFYIYNGTSVAKLGGLIATGSTWTYGTYSANQLSISSVGSGGVRVATASAPITFHTGNADADLSSERMRIDTSGNLGLGVTPSAWNTGKVMQFGTSGAFVFGDDTQQITGVNAYYNAGWKYTGTGYSTKYETSSGQHRWFNAPSGTAGAAITFTQAMTLTAAGDLGIGATSPGAKLDIAGSVGRIIAPAATTASFQVYSNAKTTGGLLLAQGYGSGSDNIAWISNESNADLLFRTNATERARIDASGNLLAGVTSGTRHWLSKNNAADYAVTINNTNANPLGAQILHSTDSNGTGNQFLVCFGSATVRAEIRSNGGLANYSANNVNLSDVRTKTDIQDAPSYLAKICAIPVRTFKYKDQTDDQLNLGAIAQEVEAVAPELVDASGFGETPEDGIPLKAIYQTDLQYALMKCIQEQQALIESLTSRIAALEAK